jgi:hypothetical protein
MKQKPKYRSRSTDYKFKKGQKNIDVKDAASMSKVAK